MAKSYCFSRTKYSTFIFILCLFVQVVSASAADNSIHLVPDISVRAQVKNIKISQIKYLTIDGFDFIDSPINIKNKALISDFLDGLKNATADPRDPRVEFDTLDIHLNAEYRHRLISFAFHPKRISYCFGIRFQHALKELEKTQAKILRRHIHALAPKTGSIELQVLTTKMILVKDHSSVNMLLNALLSKSQSARDYTQNYRLLDVTFIDEHGKRNSISFSISDKRITNGERLLNDYYARLIFGYKFN